MSDDDKTKERDRGHSLRRALNFLDLKKIQTKDSIANFIFDGFGAPEYLQSTNSRTLDRENYSAIDEHLSETLAQGYSENFIEEFFEKSLDFEKREVIDIKRNFFEPFKNELVSINNFLFIQQSEILKSSPIELSDKDDFKIDYNSFDSFYGIDFVPEPDEEEHDQFMEEYLDLADEEGARWVDYFTKYFPGFALSMNIIFLEKMLNSSVALMRSIDGDLPQFKRVRKNSKIQDQLDYLKNVCELHFHVPSDLSQIILNTRIARNMFSHGDWDNLDEFVTQRSASKIINASFELLCILSVAINRRQFALKR